MTDHESDSEHEERVTRLTIDVRWWPADTDHPKDWFAYQAQKQMGDLVASVSQIRNEDRELCRWCGSAQTGEPRGGYTTFDCGSMLGLTAERNC